MVKFFSRLPRLGNRASQTSHEHIENFIKVSRDLGNRVIPVNRAEMKISVSKQEKLTFWTLHPGYQNEFFATAHALYKSDEMANRTQKPLFGQGQANSIPGGIASGC